jgi:hypothetical protein
MAASMILAIDGATVSGFALGAPDTIPKVDKHRLKKPSEDTWLVADGAARFVRDICFIESTRPDLIAIEALMPNFNSNDEREGERQVQRSAASMLTPPLIMGAVRGIAACYGITVVQVYPATWRKHYLGRANFGSREATKAQTISRGIALGYLPKGCKDDNMADAAGVWSWAECVHGRAIPRELSLHDQGAFRHG